MPDETTLPDGDTVEDGTGVDEIVVGGTVDDDSVVVVTCVGVAPGSGSVAGAKVSCGATSSS